MKRDADLTDKQREIMARLFEPKSDLLKKLLASTASSWRPLSLPTVDVQNHARSRLLILATKWQEDHASGATFETYATRSLARYFRRLSVANEQSLEELSKDGTLSAAASAPFDEEVPYQEFRDGLLAQSINAEEVLEVRSMFTPEEHTLRGRDAETARRVRLRRRILARVVKSVAERKGLQVTMTDLARRGRLGLDRAFLRRRLRQALAVKAIELAARRPGSIAAAASLELDVLRQSE